MITQAQVNEIMNYIEKNFDNVTDMIAAYDLDVDRLAIKEIKAEETIERLKKCDNTTKDEIDQAKFEHRRANAMFEMAKGFVLALVLQDINSKIFNN